MNKISNQPPKGTSDWFPEEFAVRKYIFDTWRSVCTRFGYEEYLTPMVESADVYRAKSGEDIGGKELMTMTDRAGRELAIRPEMTPSVTRMVTRIYQDTPKPIRYFSIANFMRNEKPQRGRNREFWQLNYDIFGSDSQNADIEILQVALEIMLAFKPPKDSFTMYINDRKLIEMIICDIGGVSIQLLPSVARILDKFEKLPESEIIERLTDLEYERRKISPEGIDVLIKFMNSKSGDELAANIPQIANSLVFSKITNLIEQLKSLGYAKWITFNPSIIRGFDYYDGMVFEVFDKHPENNRSLFGGGRYNGLAGIFGSQSFPAVGCAPGDETTKLFLESWGLIDQIRGFRPKRYFAPLLSQSVTEQRDTISAKLRGENKIVIDGLEEQKIGKALEYANKKEIDYVIILGEDEKSRGVYKVKDMKSGEEAEFQLN